MIQLIEGLNSINKILFDNIGKNIGKFSVQHNKIKNGELLFHDGHLECIRQLSEIGMEIIILEFINIGNFNASIPLFDGHDKNLNVENNIVLNACVKANIDVDYVVYNSPDYRSEVPSNIITIVDERLKVEDYKNKLKLPDIRFDALRVFLQRLTSRNVTGYTFVRSYKLGSNTFALKHYCKKYLNIEMLIVHPVNLTDVPFPMYTTIKDSSILHDNTKQFLHYFSELKKDTITESDVMEKAILFEGDIEDFAIVDDPKFVGEGKIFVSVDFKGDYNSTVSVHRWL